MVLDEQTVSITCIQRLVRGFLVRKRMRSVRKAIRVLEEIRESEIKYAQQLHVVANFVLPPLLENLAGHPQSLGQSSRNIHASSNSFTTADDPSSMLNVFTAVYSHMQDLSRIHWSLANQVASLNPSWKGVAGCFKQMADQPSHELYAQYCVAFDKLSFQQLVSRKSMLDVLMGDIEISRLIRNGVVQGKRALTSANASPPKWGEPKLSSLLILPIQRLPRYLLLMDEVIKTIRQLPEDWPLVSELETLTICKKELDIMTDAVNSSKREDDISLNSERAACYIGQDHEWLAMETEAAVMALIGQIDDSETRSKKHWLKRMLSRSKKPVQNNKQTSRGSPVQRRSLQNCRRSIGHALHAKRELVLEVDLDLVESPRRGNASYLIDERHRKIVRLFVMSDIVVVTSKVGERLSILAAIMIKNLTSVVYHGQYGILTEKTPTLRYPYYRRQEFEFADATPQKAYISRLRSSSTSSYSTLARTTSILNPSLLSCGAVSRLMQALVTLCSDSTQIVNCLNIDAADSVSSNDAMMLDGLMRARRLFSAADKARISKSGKMFTYAHDEVVIQQGEPFSGLFLIVHGQVSIFVGETSEITPNEHSDDHVMRGGNRRQILHAGEMYGEGGVITGANMATMRVDSTSAEILVIAPSELFANLKACGLCERFFNLAVDSFWLVFSGKKLVSDGSPIIAEVVRQRAWSVRTQQTLVESTSMLDSQQASASTVTSEVASLLHISQTNLVCLDASDVQLRRRSGTPNGTIFVLSLGLGFFGRSYGLMHRDVIPWPAILRAHFRPPKTLVIETRDTTGSGDEMVEVLFRSYEDAARCFGAFQRAHTQSQADRAHNQGLTWDMQKSDWELLFQSSATVDLPNNGTTILQAGRLQSEPTVWIVAAGSCSLLSQQGSVQARLCPGEIFGALTFLTGGAEFVTVKTCSEMREQIIRPESSFVATRRTMRGAATSENQTQVEVQRRSNTLRHRSRSACATNAASRTTLDRTRLIKISQQTVRHLFSTHPESMVRFYRMLAKHVVQRELERQEEDRAGDTEVDDLIERRPRSYSTVV